MRKIRFQCSNCVAAGCVRYVLALVVITVSTLATAADTGDAPASYGAASHEIVVPGPFLGDEPAEDNPTFSSDTALLDDEDGFDDEGGVFAFPVLVQNGKAYDTNVFATNPLSVPATLAGWVDFDGNGSFDSDEFATATVPAGTVNAKYKLTWPSLRGVTTDFFGTSYARFRISTRPLTATDVSGNAPDGEVEDYAVVIQQDSDGDEIPDIADSDNDNDGIPDALEGITTDTDNDGIANYLDEDADGDSIPDFIEAGINPLIPADSDSDGIPDYLDTDSNNDGVLDGDEAGEDADKDGIPDGVEGSVDTDADGIVNSQDLDSDNDTIPDAIEAGNVGGAVDTDGDGIADYLDIDSDNDGLADIREANGGELNVNLIDLDGDGRVDNAQLTGLNGFLDGAETSPDSGIPIFAVVDTDADGIRDFRDLDSDNDSVSDLLETLGTDIDGNGLVDSTRDDDMDGLMEESSSDYNSGVVIDTDADGISDHQDSDADGRNQQSATPPADEVPSTPSGPDPDSVPLPDPGNPGSLDDPVNDETPVIETGLSGGAGCSVAGAQYRSVNDERRIDLVFSLLLTGCVSVFLTRRFKRVNCC